MAKLIKLALFAAGAYVVASWAIAKRPKPKAKEALPPPSKPPSPPTPPAYPTDPFYCFLHPDDPRCEGLGI